MTDAAELAQELGCRALVVDGTAVHDLGASDVQELGYVLAVGAHYLRALEAAGVAIDDATGLVEFRLAATDEQFPTIAKLRAVRRLWARMLELSGAAEDHRQMVLHAVTSRPMMTKYDPWVNMLRTCVAAFAAGVGGADAVTVLPFDARLGLPDAFARRIARNTSTLLVEESHVAKVADPAGGAFAVEKLTDDLAVAGWEELGRIEQAGGIPDGLDDLRSRIDDDRGRARRPGRHPQAADHRAHRVPEPARDAARAGAVRRGCAACPALRRSLRGAARRPDDREGLPRHDGHRRRAHGPGHVRHQPVRGRRRRRGQRGPPRRRRRRDLPHYDGQTVVCLAGHDKAYAAWGSDLVAALREAGAEWVILAGKAEELEVDARRARPPRFEGRRHCAMGVDALDFLTRTREKLA